MLSLQSADAIELTVARLREAARIYEMQIAALEKDNAYLKKENASLWEQVRDAEDFAKELRLQIEGMHR